MPTDIQNAAIQHVIGIMDQIAALNWALIISGVGICETFIGRDKARNIDRKINWCMPILLGIFFGGFEYLAHNSFTNIIQYAAAMIESICMYMGFVTVVYHLTLRPFKALTEFIKKRSKT